MRIGWVGFHVEGVPALRALLEGGVAVEAVLSLKPEEAAKRSGAADYRRLCGHYVVPLYEIKNINDEGAVRLLDELALDLVFVIGWSQIVKAEALGTARVGMIGAHASLLPQGRGRAPVNWALINGEAETGNTLIWLAEGVDEGDIIAQRRFEVTPFDDCATVYGKVAESNREMILEVLPSILAGERVGQPQPRADGPLRPGRKPADGLIDWTRAGREVYDFVRALARPYPGAFGWLDGERWTVRECALLPGSHFEDARSGQVVGAMVSPAAGGCGQVVACGASPAQGGARRAVTWGEGRRAAAPPGADKEGDEPQRGAVVLLELESDDGFILRGRALAEQDWEGKVWGDGD